MRPRRWLAVAGVVLVVGVALAVLALTTAAALPLAVALGATVLTLVAGAGTRLRHRTGWPRGRRADEPPPRRWSTSWAADPPVSAVPHTREEVTTALAGWGLTGEAVEPTLLVVTELLSNAIDHAGGPVRLSVEPAADAVHVEVRDGSPDPPRWQPPDPARPRGRGVHLVDALSLRWGWTEDPPGKVVWADVPTGWPA